MRGQDDLTVKNPKELTAFVNGYVENCKDKGELEDTWAQFSESLDINIHTLFGKLEATAYPCAQNSTGEYETNTVGRFYRIQGVNQIRKGKGSCLIW